MSLAHDTAHLLATHGHTDPDTLTTDEQRHDVRAALDHINQ